MMRADLRNQAIAFLRCFLDLCGSVFADFGGVDAAKHRLIFIPPFEVAPWLVSAMPTRCWRLDDNRRRSRNPICKVPEVEPQREKHFTVLRPRGNEAAPP